MDNLVVLVTALKLVKPGTYESKKEIPIGRGMRKALGCLCINHIVSNHLIYISRY